MIRNRDGYWQVRVDRGRDPLTGKRRFVYGRAATKKEAERLEARLVTEVADGRHKGTDVTTVGALVRRYIDWCEHVKELSPGTIATYRRHAEQKITPALGPVAVRALDPETLDTFYAELRRRGRTVRVSAGIDPKTGAKRDRTHPAPLSPSSIHEIHAILSGALQQAVKWGWITHNPARLASPHRSSRRRSTRLQSSRSPACSRARWPRSSASGCSCAWR
jgi:integrase